MKRKIVIITSTYLHDILEDIVPQMNCDCYISIAEYPDFRHIGEVYKEYEEEADGFMVSGKVAQAAIEKAVPNHKRPILSFEVDNVSMYRMLLTLFVENRELDASRVAMDFLLPFYDDPSVNMFLNDGNLKSIEEVFTKWMREIPLSEIREIEFKIKERVLELWYEKKIDMVICQFSSNIPFFEEHHIPYRYPMPTVEHLEAVLEKLTIETNLISLKENLPAVIAIMDESIQEDESPSKTLLNALEHIKNKFMLNAIVKEEKRGYHLYTSLKIVKMLTENMHTCHLRKELEEKYQLSVSIGYGLGNTITEAKEHAIEALKEALFDRKSYLINEKGCLVGPLDSERIIEVKQPVSDRVTRAAKQCGLSTLTIQKLLSVIEIKGNNQITTKELAERMGVTVRNANRVLKSMEDGGCASVQLHSSTSKGRPVKIYELNI